jgi:hypothetical protein
MTDIKNQDIGISKPPIKQGNELFDFRKRGTRHCRADGMKVLGMELKSGGHMQTFVTCALPRNFAAGKGSMPGAMALLDKEINRER